MDNLKTVIAKHWGFTTLRPLQEPAMRAVLEGRDSLVVLPTGGGKSLCYQAPAVLRADTTTVVVSPLISLMKDQVDALRACGVAAVQFDSTQTEAERYAYQMDVVQGAVRLLFTSPERLVTPAFQNLLQKINVRTFAIDEAHCISHWGHDFRPEYRQLSRLQELFPRASIHAYTATATERVRRDIIAQLRLRKPEVLVGNFDRPNLTYRVLPRRDVVGQVLEVLNRHKNEAGIIYCIRRKDVDELTDELRRQGLNARAYHAGMAAEDRKAAQDTFSKEECNLIVATVAFGMGIDRSNIRFVLHTGMPKSVEHYQQETGRAGRDGLEAECVLLYSGADCKTWEFIITKPPEGGQEPDPEHICISLQHVRDMARYCSGGVCRHRALVQYFGQQYPQPSCGACDLCLGDMEVVPDSTIVAQKILSCVARVKEAFGVNHVAHVLHGRAKDGITSRGHDKLSTFGLLRDEHRYVIQEWIRQLIGQQLVDQIGDEYPILKLNAASWEVMKGQREVRLVRPLAHKKDEEVRPSKADEVSWEGVDRDLFEALRGLRHELAKERKVPPYVLFHDGTLRQLAAVRPSNLENMKLISGIGEAKLRDLGEQVLEIVTDHCRSRNLPMDVPYRAPVREEASKGSSRLNPERNLAFKLFRQASSIEDVMHWTGRTRSTVVEYLAGFIHQERPAALDTWVKKDIYAQVASAARRIGSDRLKPLYVALGEKVSYDDIRLVLAHLGRSEAGTAEALRD
jgi:ATP-dependent DNA helicase RecQ